MSCTSTPGNRAALAVAQHVPAGYGPWTSEPSTRETRHVFHRLLREGKGLGLGSPDPADVERWLDSQVVLAGALPHGRTREAALRNLHLAASQWRADPATVSGPELYAWRHTRDLLGYERSRGPATGFTIAFDCDGVLYDFNSAMRGWLVARGWDGAALPEPHTYSLKESWNLPDEDLQREMPMAIRAGVLWHAGSTHEDGAETALMMGLAGHRILVNTARRLPGAAPEARAATITWLREQGIHPDALHMADPQDPATKLDADFDVLLDDHPENVRTALAHGREAYVVARRWNEDATDLPRVTFAEVPALVESLAAARRTSGSGAGQTIE